MPVLCRNGADCTRPDCRFAHPAERAPVIDDAAEPAPCRFGADCTRADCRFAHPARRPAAVDDDAAAAAEPAPGRNGADRTRPNGRGAHPAPPPPAVVAVEHGAAGELRQRLASTAAPIRAQLTAEKARLYEAVTAVPGPRDAWTAETLAVQKRRVALITCIGAKQEMFVAGLAALERMVGADFAPKAGTAEADDIRRRITDRLAREVKRAELANLSPYATSAREILVALQEKPVAVIRTEPGGGGGGAADIGGLRALVMLLHDFRHLYTRLDGGVMLLAPGPAAADAFVTAGFRACCDADLSATLKRGRTSVVVVPNATRLLRDAAGATSMADLRKALAGAVASTRGAMRIVLLDDSPADSDAGCCMAPEFATAAIVAPVIFTAGGERRLSGGAGAAGGAGTAAGRE